MKQYSVIVESFLHGHTTDIPQAKFKIGDTVRVFPISEYRDFRGPQVSKVLAVSDTGDGIEYALDGWDVLLWEEELRK